VDLTTDIELYARSFDLFLNAIERSAPDEHGFIGWTRAPRRRRLRRHAEADSLVGVPAVGDDGTCAANLRR
jgi:hypothetical protein